MELQRSTIRIKPTSEDEIDNILSIEGSEIQTVVQNSKDEHLQMLRSIDKKHYCIYNNSTNNLVGYFILSGFKNKNNSIELRRIVISDKGQGYGRPTVNLIKEICFSIEKKHRLWLNVFDANFKAIQLFRTEGFSKEGLLRECFLHNKEYKSVYILSILYSEFLKCSTYA